MWAKTVAWLRAAAALWAGIIGVLAILQGLNVIPTAPKVEAFVWVVSLSIIALDNVGTLVSRRIHSRRTQREEKLDQAAMSLAIALAQTQAVRFEELGICIYVETRWSKVFGRSRPQEGLKRIRRFRPAGYPQQSGVTWTSAKGTVGECWTNKTVVHKDWSAIARRWGGAAMNDDAGFKRIPEATR